MNRWKSAARKKLSRGESQKRENQKRKESKKEIIRNEKIKMREKLGKSRNTVFIQWFVAGAESAGQTNDETLQAVVARNTFPSKKHCKKKGTDRIWTLRCPTSAHCCGAKHISNQTIKMTKRSGQFWNLCCLKSTWRCGAKHLSKWKCCKHHILEPLFDTSMAITPLRREAHFQVKSVTT